MAHLELSLWSRVTRAGIERWKTSTVPSWGSWLGAQDVTEGRGHPRVKRQQHSPGKTVDWVWAAGGERRQVRHIVQNGLHGGKGVTLGCRPGEGSIRAPCSAMEGRASAILNPPMLLLRGPGRPASIISKVKVIDSVS